jgi:hypothetical protein
VAVMVGSAVDPGIEPERRGRSLDRPGGLASVQQTAQWFAGHHPPRMTLPAPVSARQAG